MIELWAVLYYNPIVEMGPEEIFRNPYDYRVHGSLTDGAGRQLHSVVIYLCGDSASTFVFLPERSRMDGNGGGGLVWEVENIRITPVADTHLR